MAARTKADPEGVVRAALLDAWNAGMELEFYRELVDSVRAALGMLADGDSHGAVGELTYALDRLEHEMTTLG